jgi:hypothetical protein
MVGRIGAMHPFCPENLDKGASLIGRWAMYDGKKELLRCLSKGFSKRRHMDIAGDKSR